MRRLEPPAVFAIVGLFWLYVTLSNVLYAYGMGTGIARATSVPVFAPWDARVLQHALLLPFLVISFWASFASSGGPCGWRRRCSSCLGPHSPPSPIPPWSSPS